MFVSLIIGGTQGLAMGMPIINNAKVGQIWPIMFIMVACGAISGFHSLVASGTTAKQVMRESQAKKIGYWGMLLESLLSVLVLCAVGSALSHTEYMNIVYPEVGKSNWILAFAVSMGRLVNSAMPFISITIATVLGILVIESFVVTTLDTAVRMNRYLFDELWHVLLGEKTPKIMRSFWFNSALSVAFMLLFALTNAVGAIWKIFGTANQLVAMLALLTVSLWLKRHGKKFHFTVLPAVFMFFTTVYSLWLLLGGFIKGKKILLLGTDVILLVLTIVIVGIAIHNFLKPNADAK
jgi:carbon starvation protein